MISRIFVSLKKVFFNLCSELDGHFRLLKISKVDFEKSRREKTSLKMRSAFFISNGSCVLMNHAE